MATPLAYASHSQISSKKAIVHNFKSRWLGSAVLVSGRTKIRTSDLVVISDAL